MERVLRGVFTETDEVMARRVNDKLNPVFCGCSAEPCSLSVSFVAEEWMLNPSGTLHGGIISTVIDMAMGVLARYCKRSPKVVTAQLSVNFLHVIRPNERFVVHVTADHIGQRSIALRADIMLEETDKLAVTASAVFM